jgi:hypothetical protein
MEDKKWKWDLNKEHAFEDEVRPRVEKIAQGMNLDQSLGGPVLIGRVVTRLYEKTKCRVGDVTDAMILREIEEISGHSG